MGKLTDLLKSKQTVQSKTKIKHLHENRIASIPEYNPIDSSTKEYDDITFDLTDEEYSEVLDSVVSIDTNGKDRRSIIIGMYGGIKNPQTQKRFVIPGLDYATEDYVYVYSKHMQMLVNTPEDFKKIMNWE